MTAAGIAKSFIDPFFTRIFGRAAFGVAAPTPDFIETPNNGRFYLPKNFNPIDIAALQRGDYEAAESDILRDYFKPDQTIIEIGANIGYVSRLACKDKLAPGGTYVAVEANALSIPSLTKNLKACETGKDIRILHTAIGIPVAKEGERQNFIQRNNLSSGLESALRTNLLEPVSSVPVRSLSSVAREFDRAGKGYSLICDAEGAEILILQKDPRSLDTCSQVAIELHHPNLTGSSVTPRDMVEIFEHLGFKHRCDLQDTHYFCRPAL